MTGDKSNEVVTKSEAARRWGVSPTAVAKYILKGMPVRSDGRLDWLTVDRHRNQYNAPFRSGNFRSRNAPAVAGCSPSDKSDTAAQRGPEFARGAEWMANEICLSSRRAWPEFVAGLNHGLTSKVLFTALMVYMVESWTEEYVERGSLPDIDWKPFGPDAEVLARECEALAVEWRQAEA